MTSSGRWAAAGPDLRMRVKEAVIVLILVATFVVGGLWFMKVI